MMSWKDDWHLFVLWTIVVAACGFFLGAYVVERAHLHELLDQIHTEVRDGGLKP